MSLRWTEYDAYTGVTEINDVSEDDWEIRTHRVQDVEPLLARTAEARNTRSADRPGKDLHLYCSIPMVIAYELLKKGINVYNPDHMPRVLQEVNSNYPHLRYSDKVHSLTHRRPTATYKGLSNDVPTNVEKVGDSLVLPAGLAEASKD